MIRGMKKDVNGDWLTLSGVAQMVGVHPSTIRVWSDQGKIPVHKTSGGHRRYQRSEIENWKLTASLQENLNPGEIFQLALRKIRTHIADGQLEKEPWSQKIEASGRDHYRESGRVLAHSLMNVLVDGNYDFRSDAVAIGSDYANRAARYGLTGQEAVRAFLFFRNSIFDSIVDACQGANVTMDAGMVKMLDTINIFMDQILLELVGHFETLRADRPTLD